MQCLALHGLGLPSEEEPRQRLQQHRLATLKQQIQESTAGAASVASASVSSFPPDSDSEASDSEAGPQHGSFQLVELSTTSVSAAAMQV